MSLVSPNKGEEETAKEACMYMYTYGMTPHNWNMTKFSSQNQIYIIDTKSPTVLPQPNVLLRIKEFNCFAPEVSLNRNIYSDASFF